MPCSILLCASRSSAESKILPQRLQRCCFGPFEPAAAVDMVFFSNYTLLRVIWPAKALTEVLLSRPIMQSMPRIPFVHESVDVDESPSDE